MKKDIALTSVLLFSFVIPFIMTYSLNAGPTPYWLFGLIFFGLFCYLFLDIVRSSVQNYFLYKQILLVIVILLVIGSSFSAAIIMRHRTAPVFEVHDIVLQLESAVRLFLEGKNPYVETYFNTPLAQWHYSDTEVNPALYHFVMQPFYLLFSVVFYGLSIPIFGYFDGRLPLYILFGLTLILAAKVVKNHEQRLLFITFLAFNPAMLPYILEGRSDMFMFAFLFAGLALLHWRRFAYSGVLLALAFATKQSVWPLFPLLICYLYFLAKSKTFTVTIGRMVPFLLSFTLIMLMVILPFIVWDPRAYFESTVLYLSGNVSHSYPISGYGFGRILYDAGFIKDLRAYYPFIWWQLASAIPLFLVLVRYLLVRTSVKRLLLSYGLLLFVFWYFSRYFNNSHLGYLSLVFGTAYFWPDEEDQKKSLTGSTVQVRSN